VTARGLSLAAFVLAAAVASAADEPKPAASPKPAETPKPAEGSSVKVGTTIFTDFTYQEAPRVLDADKNLVHKTEFEVRRAYINVVGTFSDLFVVRVTPDVAARLSTSGSGLPADARVGTSFDGSLVLRLKYAYGQVNLDRVGSWAKGGWVRLGQQPTPYFDAIEVIYRYRFQGTTFVERTGLLSSSDVGLTAHANGPAGYGDLQLGFYNGDTYTRPEANGQKAFQARASVRPLPRHSFLKGARLHAFYDHDSPVAGGRRERFVATVTFEHRHANLGFDYVSAEDRVSGLASAPTVEASGYSVWITPRTSFGLEGLFRYDHFEPNRATGGAKRETIAGVAYWIPVRKAPLTAALLLDYDGIAYDSALARPDEKRWELKALLTF
jgi:hypothetical protein